MLSDHFYHAAIRRTIAAFGTIFNDLKVVRKDGDGEVKSITRVPLAYGPKQKFLARIESQSELDTIQSGIAIKLPRMSFEITGMSYDAPSQINKMNQLKLGAISNGTRQAVYTQTPYRMSIDLSVMAKNQDDALQVVEQILPYFQPDYTITIKEIPEIGLKTDVPIVLNGVNLTDDYEGDFLSRRAIVYTLNFELRVRFYGPVKTKNVILNSSVDLNDLDTFGFLEEVAAVGDPETLSLSTGVDVTDDNAITP
jgi:hypothetical protein